MKTIFELTKEENNCEVLIGYFEYKASAEFVAKTFSMNWTIRPRELYQDQFDYDVNIKEMKKKALAKLTAEEKSLLGLTMEG